MSSWPPSRTLPSPGAARRFIALWLGVAAAVAFATIAVLALSNRGTDSPPAPSAATPDQQGAAPAGAASTRTAAPGAASRTGRSLVADPEAAQSFPQAPGAPRHAAAVTPDQTVLSTTVSPGAPNDAQVRAQLQQMEAAQKAANGAAEPGTIGVAGTVTPPRSGPVAIARVIAAANAIATFPYVYGGGHASFVDTAYDCSGSLSYALAAAGMLSAPLTSGDLMTWGAPGPGRYLTIYANPGHTFMYVDGLRYDTSGRSGLAGSRWQTAPRSLDAFAVRHWPGL